MRVRCWKTGVYVAGVEMNLDRHPPPPPQPAHFYFFLNLRFKCTTKHTFELNVYVYFEQLGLNDTKSRGDEPMEMGENLPYIDLGNIGDVAHDTPIISVGGNISCVALNTGCVKCWGSNEYGQLGQGDTRTRGDAPDEMGDSLLCVSLGSEQHSVTMIATGGYHVCALLQLQAAIELTLKCWGRNDYGQVSLLSVYILTFTQI
jgi:hypothetical protein